MSVSRKLRLVCLLCLLVCCVGCDQVSKHLARTALNHEGTRLLPGGILELRLAENPGSFLSLGAWLPPQMRFTLFTLGVGAGLAVLAAYLVRTARMDVARFIGFSLVMAGGIGNLIDRVVWKGV
ncbi:MAG: signal peptidase II, partial [Verrucomicrobiota bacterium]